MPVEVVMPIFNGKNYLAQQIESIYQQTLRPARLLIRDDGSTDGTLELIASLEHRYGNWIHRVDGNAHLGCCASVNVLLSATRARYVALADQDDIWHPEKLEQSLELLRQMESLYGETTPLLVHGDLRLVDAEGQPMGHTFFAYQRLDPRRTSPADLAFTNVVTGCTCLFNRSLLTKALPIPAEAAMHDWWIALVASVFGRIGLLNRVCIDYRQHSHNLLGATGLGWDYWFPRLLSILRGKRNKHQVMGVLWQSAVFRQRYGIELSELCSIVRLPFAQRWLSVLRLPANKRPSKHGLLRSGLFYARMLTTPARFFCEDRCPDVRSMR